MDEPMLDDTIIPDGVRGAVGDDTHAARWARPRLEAFDSKEKDITFQVSFRLVPSLPRRKSHRDTCHYFLACSHAPAHTQ